MFNVERLVASSLLALLAGCATASPVPISAEQERTFRDTILAAERANASGRSGEAATALQEAKSDFYYAEHSPMNPERARTMAVRAQHEADAAVVLSRGQ
jgi:hypothetical protein